MEQFKHLKWSWHKYEEEKKHLPRKFSFETINDNDALSRNLNEIHTCVVPKQNEYRIFKTPEEIALNHFELDNSGHVIELKDPRKYEYHKLEASHNLIKEYSYSSELRDHEQLGILNYLASQKLFHNPKLLKIQKSFHTSNFELSKELQEKWQQEADHFNRCAEIYYHRHITQFNNIICEKFRDVLIEKWKKIEVKFPRSSYQAITMIVRNPCSKAPVNLLSNHIESLTSNFNTNLYMLPNDHFPIIQKVSYEEINFFLQNREIFAKDNELTSKCDIQISLNVLAKLFLDGTEFNTIFINENSCTKFLFKEVVPLKKATNSCDALEEVVKEILYTNIEWYNASKCVQTTNTIDYKLYSIRETMSMIFKKYKKRAGINNEINLWTLEKCLKQVSISISRDVYFINEHTKVIISVKFEYQLHFGAEQMTKEELLNEWIQMKFSLDTIIMRFRIDARSLEILSVIHLNIEEIEKELSELYKCDPLEALDILFNVFNCIYNLPDAQYIIQAQRNDKDCNKLLIYKEAFENGKHLINDEAFGISETFTRKWLLIDRKVVNFIHINKGIAPCCFSYKTSHQKMSYIIPKTKKVITKNIGKHKSPQKLQILRKRSKRKQRNKMQRKITVAENLK